MKLTLEILFQTDESDDSDDEDPEHWDIPATSLDDELGIDVEPAPLKTVNSLLFYFVYAILYLQVVHHISDNGVEHLLRFLFRFFQVLGVNVNSQLLAEFCVGFPPSLYLARKLVKLDRDDFKRFAVCRLALLCTIFFIVFLKGMVSGMENFVKLKIKYVVRWLNAIQP